MALKNLCIFSISLLANLSALAQTYSFEWVAEAGGLGGETVSARSAVDASGNVYNVGVFDSITDVDPGPGVYNLYSGHHTSDDIYVRKLDPSGNLIWVFQLGVPELADEVITLNLDPFGNIVITGFFGDSLDLDPTAGITDVVANPFSTEMYIAKYSPTGNLIWAKQTTGTSGSAIIPVTSRMDAVGNLYVTGELVDTVDMDPGPGISTLGGINQSLFVSKYDNSGNLVWAKALGSSSCVLCESRVTSLCLDQSGSVLLTGLYRGTNDFDPGPGVSNLSWPGTEYQIFICKLDPLGNFIWAEAIGNRVSIYDLTADIVGDALGNFYITGCYDTIADMDPGPGVTNLAFTGTIYNDIFICKFNSSGNLIWAKGIGGNGLDIPGTLVLDHDRLLLGGFFQYAMDFDPGPGSYNMSPAGSYDSFILVLDTSSTFVNALQLKSEPGAYNFGRTLIRDVSGNLYFTGSFEDGSTDFDPGPLTQNLYALGLTDNAFVVKLHASLLDVNESKNGSVSIFPNPGSSGFSFTAFTRIEKIEIRNVLGQTVFEEVEPTADFVNMASFADGLYTILFSSEGHTTARRWLKSL